MKEAAATSLENASHSRLRFSKSKLQTDVNQSVNIKTKQKHKKLCSYIKYTIVGLLIVCSIVVPITFSILKKPSVYYVSQQSTSTPITDSGRTGTTTEETDATVIRLDECDRKFVALTKRLPQHISTVSVADINNDENIDIVFTIEASYSIYIIFNRGNNRFEQMREYTLVSYGRITCVKLADIDNDNRIDIIVGVMNSDISVRILKNNGQGEFNIEWSLKIDFYPIVFSIYTADMNQDQLLDIIVTTPTENLAGIFYQQSDSTFDSMREYRFGQHLFFLAITDLNNDNWLDVVATNTKLNTFSIWYNQGNMEFLKSIDYQTDVGPTFVTTADLNNDGYLDIQLINFFSNNVVLYSNDGTGRFFRQANITNVVNPISIALADLNNDSSIDIIVPNYHSNNILVYLNNGNGIFTDSIKFTTYPLPREVTTADLNDDGKLDLIFANDNYVAIILSRCDC